MTLEKKTEIIIAIVKAAGALALKLFQDLSNLNVEKKFSLISLRYPAAHGQQLPRWINNINSLGRFVQQRQGFT